MKSSSAKNKGRFLQKLTRDLLLSLASHLEPEDILSTSMGCGGEDLKFSPAARRAFSFDGRGISIECKNQERLNVWASYDQAAANAGDYEPVLVIKKNRVKHPLAVVRAEHYFRLLRQ